MRVIVGVGVATGARVCVCGATPLSHLLALHAADHDEVVALFAFDHLALHLLESVRQRRPGQHAGLDRLTVNAL